MKNMKKCFSILLALVMVFALTATAMAATITKPSADVVKDHTFEAYQIFTGTQANGKLGEVDWGNGINKETFLQALTTSEDLKKDGAYVFASCTTAAEVANVLSQNTDMAKAFTNLANIHKGTAIELTAEKTTVDDGYYLIYDAGATDMTGSAFNTTLLQVVGDVTISVKTDAPEVEKKVKEDDVATDSGYGAGYNDVADYDVGDEITFRLIGKVPEMKDYDTYKYIFHDTMSEGLDLVADSFSYSVADDQKGTSATPITGFTYEAGTNGETFTLTCNDLKKITDATTGKYIIVEYKAKLNEKAKIGLPGNPNEVYLQYSNKPDQSGSGDNNTGNTPKDKVIVFTYQLNTTKIDGATADATEQTKLKDAEFVLLNSEGKIARILNTNGKPSSIVWNTAPTAEKEGDEIPYSAYGEEKEGTGGSTILKSNAQGLFSVTGLDDGTYYLREIKAPAGYNILTKDITVIVDATTSYIQTWDGINPGEVLTDLTVTADENSGSVDTNKGIASITVANNSGSTLPSTGGMGTTILYIAGGVLVAAAAVMLIVKRRMGVEK